MKLHTGLRIGQSQGELMAAILFSSIFHVIVITAALFIAYTVRARVHVPQFYSVKLVELPGDVSQAPVMTPQEQAPVVPKAVEEPKRPPQAKTPPAVKPAPLTRKDAMPELKDERQKKPAPISETPRPRQETAARPQDAVTVAVAGAPQDKPFPPYYVAIIRDKVERNWNPPPGAKGATVQVLFTILRSGRVGESKLLASSGNFYFDQAAMRAILSSSPFPPLPEGFFRDQETFSVDLMERE